MRVPSVCLALLCLSSISYTSTRSLELYRNSRAQIAAPAVRIARQAVTTYLETGRAVVEEKGLPEAFRKKAAVFVTISSNGRRRGCAGGFEPAAANLRDEIVLAAIRAATADTRYRAVRAGELDRLTFTVSIVGPLTPVSDPSRYPPAAYGLLARNGPKSGVILPGEAKTSRWGLSEAKRQAGIRPDEPCELYVFETVTLTERPGAKDGGRR